MIDYEAVMLNKEEDHKLRDGFLSLFWFSTIVAAVLIAAYNRGVLDAWVPDYVRAHVSTPVLIGFALSIASLFINWVFLANQSWRFIWIDLRKYLVVLGLLALATDLLPADLKALTSVEGFTAFGFLVYRLSDLASDVANMGTQALLRSAAAGIRPRLRERYNGVSSSENAGEIADIVLLRVHDNAQIPRRTLEPLYWVARESRDARTMLILAQAMERISLKPSDAEADLISSFGQRHLRAKRWTGSGWA